jgi:hypothetical protein
MVERDDVAFGWSAEGEEEERFGSSYKRINRYRIHRVFEFSHLSCNFLASSNA